MKYLEKFSKFNENINFDSDKITYGSDFIVDIYDDNSIVKNQGDKLIENLDGWVKYLPSAHQGINRESSMLFSPIFSDKSKLDIQITKIDNALDRLIKSLNNDEKTISRVTLKIYQSNNEELVIHPKNEIKGNVKFLDDSKNKLVREEVKSDFIFNQTLFFTDNNHVYGNKFEREYNDFEIDCKYYTLVLSSPYGSI
jgi:hypothetical protein